MSSLPASEALALAGAIVAVAYVVFGLTGFGASIVGLPFLAQLYPLRVLVPTMLTFDLCAAALLGLRQRAHVDGSELRRLLPVVVIGMLLGVTALAHAPERWLLMGLGTFILAYAAWSLVVQLPSEPVAARWAWPAGAIGGVLTALYGTGGPVYTMYLARRLADKAVLRATIGTLVLCTALIRLVLFAGTGLLLNATVLRLTLSLLPCALLGYFLGSRLHRRISAQAASRLVWAVLLAGALGMLWRSLAMA